MLKEKLPTTNNSFGLSFSLHKFLEPLEQKRPIQLEGIGAWGSAGNKKWVIFPTTEEPSPDTTISTQQIILRIRIYPAEFEITIPEKQLANVESMELFLSSLRRFVTGKGYGFKALPMAKLLPALPAPPAIVDDIEITESFEGFITKLEGNVASVILVDDSGDKSYMEIPYEDLKKHKIECKPGILFSFVFKRRGDWETVELAPTHRPPMTRAELDKLLNYYEEKYGDV